MESKTSAKMWNKKRERREKKRWEVWRQRFITANFICNTICWNFLTLVWPLCTVQRICHMLSISYNTQLSSRAFLSHSINKNAKCEYLTNASATTLQRTILELVQIKEVSKQFFFFWNHLYSYAVISARKRDMPAILLFIVHRRSFSPKLHSINMLLAKQATPGRWWDALRMNCIKSIFQLHVILSTINTHTNNRIIEVVINAGCSVILISLGHAGSYIRNN